MDRKECVIGKITKQKTAGLRIRIYVRTPDIKDFGNKMHNEHDKQDAVRGSLQISPEQDRIECDRSDCGRADIKRNIVRHRRPRF